MIGGLVTSTIHVLVVTPVLFSYMKERALKRGDSWDIENGRLDEVIVCFSKKPHIHQKPPSRFRQELFPVCASCWILNWLFALLCCVATMLAEEMNEHIGCR